MTTTLIFLTSFLSLLVSVFICIFARRAKWAHAHEFMLLLESVAAFCLATAWGMTLLFTDNLVYTNAATFFSLALVICGIMLWGTRIIMITTPRSKD